MTIKYINPLGFGVNTVAVQAIFFFEKKKGRMDNNIVPCDLNVME